MLDPKQQHDAEQGSAYLTELKARIAANAKPKAIAGLVGKVTPGARKEAGWLFNEYKAGYIKPTISKLVAIVPHELWSLRNGRRSVVMRKDRLEIEGTGRFVVTGSNLVFKQLG